MYPLDAGMWGPTVRISHLRDELARLVDLDVVAGYRGARRLALARYAASGRLRGLDGIYVESSSFLPAEVDLAFLGLARALGVRVLTYVRDAYQLFPDEYPRTSVRRWIGARAFGPALTALGAVSTAMAFPTRRLACAVLGAAGDAAILLPPGSPALVAVPRAETANRLLYVGDARLPAHGAERLIDAVRRARRRGTAIELLIVCRPGQEPPGPHPPWVRLARAEGRQINALLPGVLAAVIPRPRSAYNDLALPVKLFDYLSYGRPLLVTDCAEQAAVVREAHAGVIVGDDPEQLAEGVRRIASAPGDELDRWSYAAHAAASVASWRSRAERVVEWLRNAR
jgi:hypothetical protein